MDHRGRLLGSIGRDRWGYPAANAPAQTRQQATSYAFPKILTRSKEYASAPDYTFQAQAEARTERHDAATQHARPGVRVRRRRPAVITALVLSLVGAGAWFIFGAPQSRAPGDLLTQADRWIADNLHVAAAA